MKIRPAKVSDEDAIAEIFLDVLKEGETFALPCDLGRDEALVFWFAPGADVFVCQDAGQVLGSYYLKPNHTGAGAHVANAGYIVDRSARGKHVGRLMAEHSVERARARGFQAMQFNFVVSTNEAAVHLWKSMGFDIVGTLPKAFQHPVRGYVDALVMFRQLEYLQTGDSRSP